MITSHDRIEVKTWQLISWRDVIYFRGMKTFLDSYRIETSLISGLHTCIQILVNTIQYMNKIDPLLHEFLCFLYKLKRYWKLIWKTVGVVPFHGYRNISKINILTSSHDPLKENEIENSSGELQNNSDKNPRLLQPLFKLKKSGE